MEDAGDVKKEQTHNETRVSNENNLWILYRIWAEESITDEMLHAMIEKW